MGTDSVSCCARQAAHSLRRRPGTPGARAMLPAVGAVDEAGHGLAELVDGVVQLDP